MAVSNQYEIISPIKGTKTSVDGTTWKIFWSQRQLIKILGIEYDSGKNYKMNQNVWKSEFAACVLSQTFCETLSITILVLFSICNLDFRIR